MIVIMSSERQRHMGRSPCVHLQNSEWSSGEEVGVLLKDGPALGQGTLTQKEGEEGGEGVEQDEVRKGIQDKAHEGNK